MLRALHGSKPAVAGGIGGGGDGNGKASWTMSSRVLPAADASRSRFRNSAGVMWPSVSAFSPYCTPTLSHVMRA